MKYTITNSKTGQTMTIEANSPEEASLKALEGMGFVVEEAKDKKKQRYFFHAHMEWNKVKVGDKVKKYKTQIGTIGNANSDTSNNHMYSHDHFGCYVDLTVKEFYNYIFGWSKERVQKHYLNPHKLGLDFTKIYPETQGVDVGNRGYDYLQSIKNSRGEHIGYHPAVDVNDERGGDIDFGQKIMSPCDGEVIHSLATWKENGGWGNVIIIKED